MTHLKLRLEELIYRIPLDSLTSYPNIEWSMISNNLQHVKCNGHCNIIGFCICYNDHVFAENFKHGWT